MVSRRQIRGFDPARLRVALGLLPLRVLRAALDASGETSRGSKDDVVDRLHAQLVRGTLPFRVVCDAAKKTNLQRICSEFEVDIRGRKTELSGRVERAVRYGPLGNLASLPEGFEKTLNSDLNESERLLALELHARLRARNEPVTRLALTDLIGRLGHHRAEFRVRRVAARRVGEFLYAQGIATDPDLRTITTSPGRDAVIVLTLVSAAEPELSIPARPLVPVETDRADDAEATLALGVANADNHQHPKELELIRARLASESLGDARRLLERLRTDAQNIELASRRLAASAPLEQRRDLFRHLVEVAWADGVLVEAEEELLRTLGEALKLGQSVVDAALSDRSPDGSSGSEKHGSSQDGAPAVREEGPPYRTADPYVDEILELLFA